MESEEIASPCIYHTMLLVRSTPAPVATQLFTQYHFSLFIQPA